jgi:hypothetical protein
MKIEDIFLLKPEKPKFYPMPSLPTGYDNSPSFPVMLRDYADKIRWHSEYLEKLVDYTGKMANFETQISLYLYRGSLNLAKLPTAIQGKIVDKVLSDEFPEHNFYKDFNMTIQEFKSFAESCEELASLFV